MKNEPLTIIVTSCDRFDLLERTLDSFFKMVDCTKYWIESIHINNDSVNRVPVELKKKYADYKVVWHEGVKRGLSGSWDYLVSQVRTEYFFNIEDDWDFYVGGNKLFLDESYELIKSYEYDQVWIRSQTDHNHPLKKVYGLDLVQHTSDWCGFTFNPSLRRLSLWEKWFPKGIEGKDEIDLSRQLKGNYLAVSLKDSAIRHIGGGRHVKEFVI